MQYSKCWNWDGEISEMVRAAEI